MLTIVKGARGSGKSQYIIDNLISRNLVLCVDVPMLRIFREKLIKQMTRRNNAHIRTYYRYPFHICVEEGRKITDITTTVADNAFDLLNKFQSSFHHKTGVFIDEFNYLSPLRLERIMSIINKCHLDLTVTFTPKPINPLNANYEVWLRIGDLYEGDIRWVDLGARPYDSKNYDYFRQMLSESAFRTEILGEFVIEDNS